MKFSTGLVTICIVFISKFKFSDGIIDDDYPELFNRFVIQTANKFGAEPNPKVGEVQEAAQLSLANAQKMQHWLLRVAEQFVVPDPVFDGVYVCRKELLGDMAFVVSRQKLAKWLSIGNTTFGDEELRGLEQVAQSEMLRFFKLLFSMGARLSAMVEGVEGNNPELQQHPLKAFLGAFNCVGRGDDSGGESIYNYHIDPICGENQWNVQGIIFTTEQGNWLGIKNFTYLRQLNQKTNEFGPEEVLHLANYLRYIFIEGNQFGSYFYSSEPIPRNPFQASYLEKLGLEVTELDKDPLRHRRVAQQLVVHLKGWTGAHLQIVATIRSSVPLELHELCTIGTFGRNLLRRVVGYRLLEEFGIELGLKEEMVKKLKNQLEYFEGFAAEKCNKMIKDKKQREEFVQKEGYLLFDEAFRLDFNIWNAIIRNIDLISGEMKRKQHKKEELEKYTKSIGYREAMDIIGTKFESEKYGLKLQLDDGEHHRKRDKLMEKFHIKEDKCQERVETFLENLKNVKQICKGESERFEREIPMKKQQKVINEKLRGNLEQFYGLVIRAIWQKYEAKEKQEMNRGKKLKFTLKNANLLLGKLYELANRRFGPKCKERKSAKSLDFVGMLRDILGPKFDGQIEQMQHEFYTVEELDNLRINGPKRNAKPIIDKQLSKLLYSFAARLEAMIHGKGENSENAQKSGENTTKSIKNTQKNVKNTTQSIKNAQSAESSQKNDKDTQKSGENSSKIGTFLATSNCFALDYWVNTKYCIAPHFLEIAELVEENQKVFGVIIHKEVRNQEFASKVGQDGYQLLNRLNNGPFSIYRTLVLLTELHDKANPQMRKGDKLKKAELAKGLMGQIENEYTVRWGSGVRYMGDGEKGRITPCECARLAEQIRAKFEREMAKNGKNIGPIGKYMHYTDEQVQEELEKAKLDNCGTLENRLKDRADKVFTVENFVRYDLVVSYNFSPWQDLYDRIDDLLFGWEKVVANSKENIFGQENEEEMIEKLSEYLNENVEQRVGKVDELAPKEPFKLGGDFGEMSEMTENAKKMQENYRKIEKQWDEVKKAKVGIKHHAESVAKMGREIKEKEKEIAGIEKKIDRQENSVQGEEGHRARELAHVIRNGDKKQKREAAERNEIFVKIREFQGMKAKLDKVEEKAKEKVKRAEGEVEEMRKAKDQHTEWAELKSLGQKLKHKATTEYWTQHHAESTKIDQLKEAKDFQENKVNLLGKKMAELQGKIHEIFGGYEATYQLKKNSGPNEAKIEDGNLEGEFERIQRASEQIMKGLKPELDALSKALIVEDLKNIKQGEEEELEKLSQELEELKGRKPRKYSEEERASVEKELGRAKTDMERQMQLVRESAQKYQQTLTEMKEHFGQKAKGWEDGSEKSRNAE